MPSKPNSKDGLRKNGTSKRTRAGNSDRGKGTPPIMFGALVVVVIGAAFLFWPKSGPDLSGIGEQQTVVTIPDSAMVTAASGVDDAPRSSDVDISRENKELVPEKPVGKPAKEKKTEPEPVKTQPKPKAKPKSQAPRTVPEIKPQPDGRWAVQTGGFGDAANADKEAARLQSKGWQAMVRAGSNSQGHMVYRVWIGYFPSRDNAGAFIKQNKKQLSDAFVVHR